MAHQSRAWDVSRPRFRESGSYYLFDDELLADEAWAARYKQELKAKEEIEIKLNGRLNGSVAVSEW